MWRKLSEMTADNEACESSWSPSRSTLAKLIEDRRDLIAEVERLREALGRAIKLAEEWGDVLPSNTYMLGVLAPLKALAAHDPGQQPDSDAQDEGDSMDRDVKEAWDWACYTRASSSRSRVFLDAVELLRGAQTHLLDGDNSNWRRKLDAFVRSCGCESEEISTPQPIDAEGQEKQP